MLSSERGRKTVLGINLALAGLLWVYSLAMAQALPARLPMHYNGAGGVDSWRPASLGFWLLLPLIGVGMNVLLFGVGWLMRLLPPTLINFPCDSMRQAFLLLSPEERRPVFRMMESFTLYMLIPMNALWLLLQVSDYMVGAGKWKVLPMFSWAFIAAIGVISVIMIPQMTREMRRYLEEKGVAGGTH